MKATQALRRTRSLDSLSLLSLPPISIPLSISIFLFFFWLYVSLTQYVLVQEISNRELPGPEHGRGVDEEGPGGRGEEGPARADLRDRVAKCSTDSKRVEDPGGVDPEPTFEKNPDLTLEFNLSLPIKKLKKLIYQSFIITLVDKFLTKISISKVI